jgi:hypothetical protein
VIVSTGKKFRGQQSAGLGGEKGAPLTASRASLWWGAQTGAAQHPTHGGSADPVPKAPQLTMHAAEGGVALGEAEAGEIG